jgi:hypothetical protein
MGNLLSEKKFKNDYSTNYTSAKYKLSLEAEVRKYIWMEIKNTQEFKFILHSSASLFNELTFMP